MSKSRLALAAAALAILMSSGSARAATWITTALPWKALPASTQIGPLPQTLKIPPKAWDYGAASAPTNPFVKSDAVILKIDLTVGAGRLGVSLMPPDGSSLLSKERVITAQNGATHIYFRLTPPAQPSMIVLRNFDSEGQEGAVTITATQFIRESDLSNDELTEIVKAGIL